MVVFAESERRRACLGQERVEEKIAIGVGGEFEKK